MVIALKTSTATDITYTNCCGAFLAMDAFEFIDIMRPEHDRTSCSDDDLNNGFHSRGDGTWHGRCTRCMWLEIAKDEQDLPEGFNYEECEG